MHACDETKGRVDSTHARGRTSHVDKLSSRIRTCMLVSSYFLVNDSAPITVSVITKLR